MRRSTDTSRAVSRREATDALEDAADCADELAERYKHYGEAALDADGETASDASASDDATDQINDGISRLQDDIDAIEQTTDGWRGREQAIAAMRNLQEALSYELDIIEAQKAATKASKGKEGTKAALATISALDEEYQEIDPPDCLKEYLQNTLDKMPTILTALEYSVKAPDSTLSQYTTTELITWWIAKQGAYDALCNDILVKQCQASGELLRGIAKGDPLASSPSVSADIIDEIAPNLYPSLDSVANMGITSSDDAHAVQVEAEIVGLSQKHEQRYDLAQGYNFIPIKPALLPAKDLPDLSSNSTTHLNVKVTDVRTGEVLAQESHPVNLLSMYDVRWTNDEFGLTATFDILAWLRPQADEVNAVNRAAADVIGDWTGGQTYWTLSGSSEEWENYFSAKRNESLENGGIFVIDCDMQQVMGIQGLENV